VMALQRQTYIAAEPVTVCILRLAQLQFIRKWLYEKPAAADFPLQSLAASPWSWSGAGSLFSRM
jgi:hypothetical protein